MSLPLLALLALPAPQIIGDAPSMIGPFIGKLGPREASVLVRFRQPDQIHMALVDGTGRIRNEITLVPDFELDRCVRWDLRDLEPDSTYAVTVYQERIFFKTPSEPERPSRVRLAIGSCADDRPGLANPVWPAIQKDSPDVVLLIGDTPYIDSTDLAMQRRRYVEFFGAKGLSTLLKRSTLCAMWDDHDFAGNNSDGKAPGKENARKAFLEYHANPSAGEDGQGVYTRFRRGSVDVFLLDTRWFSGTESSFADPARPTLLGAKQWAWLQRELQASKAPFKLLVSGIVWNGAVPPGKTDTWAACPHERDALFRFLAGKSIEGVVLVSGDLHRSRALVHPAAETGVAYPLRELVTSPLGSNPQKEAGVASPAVVFDSAEANAWLLVTADSTQKPPLLTASFRSAGSGELRKIEIGADELRFHAAILPAPRSQGEAEERTKTVLARGKSGRADLVFLGDSITEGWEGAGQPVWEATFGKRKALNLGVGGDRTQHVLWRLDQGQLDQVRPKLVVLMIGTNNSNGSDNTSAEIGQGIEAIVGRIRTRSPGTKILLLAIFPRGEKPNEQRAKNDEASHLAEAAVADGKSVVFLDIGPGFLEKDGTLSKEIMPDSLHLSEKGYRIWAEAIEGKVREMLGE